MAIFPLFTKKTNKFRKKNAVQKKRRDKKEITWFKAWLGGLGLTWLWLYFFLNAPARQKIETAMLNTFAIAVLATTLALALAWGYALTVYYARRKGRFTEQVSDILFSTWRALPQILGLLFGYVLLAYFQQSQHWALPPVLFFLALTVALVVFPELGDLLLERIAYFQKSDFFDAMRVSGVRDSQIINYDILFKNSRVHILNKLIAVFGMTFFLLISVDFIVSVGLSQSVSLVNMPKTLGNILAHIDSKQDILAIGRVLSHPGQFISLFFTHLQGVSVAFIIVFSLLALYKISQHFSRRLEI